MLYTFRAMSHNNVIPVKRRPGVMPGAGVGKTSESHALDDCPLPPVCPGRLRFSKGLPEFRGIVQSLEPRKIPGMCLPLALCSRACQLLQSACIGQTSQTVDVARLVDDLLHTHGRKFIASRSFLVISGARPEVAIHDTCDEPALESGVAAQRVNAAPASLLAGGPRSEIVVLTELFHVHVVKIETSRDVRRC